MFAVGRSGSGKSTAVRYITQLANDRKVSTTYISDYTILQEMSMQIEHRKKFRLNEYNGFDVLDFSVMDLALEELVRRVNELYASQEYDVIFVEFARDTYSNAFRMFASASLLNTAYILFVEAELDTCIERIYRRVLKSHGPDFHFLSDGIMRKYFWQNNLLYFTSKFEREFSLLKRRLKIVYNQGSVEVLEIEAKDIAECIFQDVLYPQETHTDTRPTLDVLAAL